MVFVGLGGMVFIDLLLSARPLLYASESSRSRSTAALECSVSRAANTRVTAPYSASSRSFVNASCPTGFANSAS